MVIAKLKAHESELRALGIERLSLFGSMVDGDVRDGNRKPGDFPLCTDAAIRVGERRMNEIVPNCR